MTSIIPWALKGLGSCLLSKTILLLFLTAYVCVSSPLQAQPAPNLSTISLDAYGIGVEILPVPGTKDDWTVVIWEDSSQSPGKEIQSVSIQLDGITPFNKAAFPSLSPGNHPFNTDGHADWKIHFDPVSGSFHIKGIRPTGLSKAGSGTLISITLSNTGISHQDKAIVCAGGLVIADVAIGAKRGQEEEIMVGPNPATEYVDIKGLNGDRLTIQLLSATGKTLLQQSLKHHGTYRIWLDRLKPGLYTLAIYDPHDLVKNIKLVIQ